MKTIGLIGGMSWESTIPYYRIINQTIAQRLGGLHSAKILMYSVDFDEIEHLQVSGEWDKSGYILGEVAQKLEKAGAEFIVLCTNTMHKVVPIMETYISIPLLHIAEATIRALNAQNIKTIGLLGTRYTMEQDFYKERLIKQGLSVLIPDENERVEMNRIIFEEHCQGTLSEKSKSTVLQYVESLHKKGAEGIILGCTEIGLLIQQNNTRVPLFNTTEIHAIQAAEQAL